MKYETLKNAVKLTLNNTIGSILKKGPNELSSSQSYYNLIRRHLNNSNYINKICLYLSFTQSLLLEYAFLFPHLKHRLKYHQIVLKTHT